jgi:hypothetical protein
MKATTLINLHGRGVRPGEAVIRDDGEVLIRGWIYIGRAQPRLGIPQSQWCNRFHVGRDGTHEDVVAAYEEYIAACPALLARLPALKGRLLAC